MKQPVWFIACSVGLTVLFYVLAYYLLPPPPPSAAMVLLFAAFAMLVVWLISLSVRKVRARGQKKALLWFVISGATIAVVLGGCSSAPHSAKPAETSGSANEASNVPPPPPPPPVSSPAPQAEYMPRITGTALLLPSQKEEAGYGLYSYALLAHTPGEEERPKYKAFFRALLALPTAKDVEQHGHVDRKRINVTYMLLNTAPRNWEGMKPDQQVDFVLDHYDCARASVMLASLPRRTGPGPVIVSTLAPLDPAQHPHPVLVQDMSPALPQLMDAYVSAFVQQAAMDRFYNNRTLSQFALSLRNLLEVSATGLGMSTDAVQSWVKYFK